MPQSLSIFSYSGIRIRTVEKDGTAWFVAKDVAVILGYQNTRKAISDHCKHAQPIGGNDSLLPIDPQTIIIPHGDLVRLIVKSQLPSAERFESWVMDEVMPSILKTGTYSMNPQELIARAVIEAQKMIEHQTALIAEMKPKADFFDTVTDSTDAVEIGLAAKTLNLGIGRNKLFTFLRDNKVLMRNNTPYQEYIDRGYFRVIESSYSKPDGSNHINIKTVVFQKGLDFIRRRLVDEREAA